MVLKNYINKELKDKEGNEIPLTRPNGVSTRQWTVAMELYKTSKSRGDKYPELTVAQAALESAWFKKESGDLNFFGQKASKNQKGKIVNTKEVENNSSFNTKAKFRSYNNLEEAVDDRIDKWASKYNSASSVEEAIYKIWSYDEKTGKGKGYATDDKYDIKIKKILGMIGVPLSTPPIEHKQPTSKKSLFQNETKEIIQDTTNPNNFMFDVVEDKIEAPVAQPNQEVLNLDSIISNYEKSKEIEKQLIAKSFNNNTPQPQQEIDVSTLLSNLYSDQGYNNVRLDD